MRSELILKRPDKSQVQITVDFSIDNLGPIWRVYVMKKEPGKKKWQDVFEVDYAYRNMSMEQRSEYRNKKQMELVTDAEIWQAKMQVWESLKPEKP